MLKKLKYIQPAERGFYAFNHQRAGDFLIFYKFRKNYYDFFYIPGGDLFSLAEETFDHCIKTDTISLVEILPKNIYEETIRFVLSNTKDVGYNPTDEKIKHIS